MCEVLMTSRVVVCRWENLELTKVTEMVSRKSVAVNSQVVSQVYLKRGAHIPLCVSESDRSIYVLQGVLRMLVDDKEILVGEGEIIHIPARLTRQAEALDDTFAMEFINTSSATE